MMLQSARNLVSAMKGGRGPRKLRVKWAPEVYDPIPTSVSHTTPKKQQQSSNRGGKNNKKKKCRDRDRDKAKKKQSRKKERHNDVTNSSSHCASSLITNYSLAL